MTDIKVPDSNLIVISEPTLRRLPVYYNYLKRKHSKGVSNISGPVIANDLDLTPIQVRKDLQAAGAVGKPKIGYDIMGLISTIENCLGYNNIKDALLVGAGNLGLALLGYKGFAEYGLNIVAAFDTDPSKIGTNYHGKMIYDLQQFKSLAKRMKIRIGIITTPASSARVIAQLMIESGIEAIWNFAPVYLSTPENIIVQYENLTASLSVLSNKLLEKSYQ